MTGAVWAIFLAVSIAGRIVQAQTEVCLETTGGTAPANECICNVATQEPAASPAAPDSSTDKDPLTIFSKHQWGRFRLSGQMNIIEQAHGNFRALYSGPNSLRNNAEHAASRIFTLYTAVRLSDASDVVFHLEQASGLGIGNSLGLAGYTNIDVVRIPGEGSPLSTAPYVARVLFRYVIPLSGEAEEAAPGPLSMLTKLPSRRLELRVGKLSLPDLLDVNAIGGDSHFQFANWTIVNNGAWDYAADTRGYTWAAYAEYHDVNWSVRFAEALMPKIANGIDLQWNLLRARGHNLELELLPHVLAKRNTTVRVLAFRNIADMGNYREANRDFLAHQTAIPDIVSSRRPGRKKTGLGLNFEQELTSSLRAFLRVGWNDGHNESFAYTEVDQTLAGGVDFRGPLWHRKNDKIGLAFVTNGISADHQAYLALGGHGFLLGDGALNYGRENIVESYYTVHIWRGLFVAPDLQHIQNPGYNRDRGPVWVPGLRLHLEF